MGINYYSKEKCDWRLTVSAKGLSFLQVVGSENLLGTIRHTRKYLEWEDSHKN